MTDSANSIPVETDLTPKVDIRPPKEQSLRLGIFAAVVAIVVLLSNTLIGPSIALRAQEDRQAMFAQVLPDSLYDNDPSQEQATVTLDGQEVTYYRARFKGEVSAIIMQIASQGYAGPIQLLVAARTDGTLTGVRVLSHNETPGLGDQIEANKNDWILQFAGLSLDEPGPQAWHVKKDGGQFDAFTGATITPRAVVAGIRLSLELMQTYQSTLLDQQEQPQTETNHE